MKKLFLLSILSIQLLTIKAQDTPASVLKASDVENFIENYKDIVQEFEQAELDVEVMSNLDAFVDGTYALNEVERILKKYNYANTMDFYTKVLAITMSYASLRTDTDLSPEIKAAMQEIENNDMMTSEQKDAAKQQMAAVLGAMSVNFSALVSPEDVEVVKPYLGRLDILFEEE